MPGHSLSRFSERHHSSVVESTESVILNTGHFIIWRSIILILSLRTTAPSISTFCSARPTASRSPANFGFFYHRAVAVLQGVSFDGLDIPWECCHERRWRKMKKICTVFGLGLLYRVLEAHSVCERTGDRFVRC